MKLVEKIAACEALGFRLRGFIVAPDVKAAIDRELSEWRSADDQPPRIPTMMAALATMMPSGSLSIRVSDLLPPGYVAPDFDPPNNPLSWRLLPDDAEVPT